MKVFLAVIFFLTLCSGQADQACTDSGFAGYSKPYQITAGQLLFLTQQNTPIKINRHQEINENAVPACKPVPKEANISGAGIFLLLALMTGCLVWSRQNGHTGPGA